MSSLLRLVLTFLLQGAAVVVVATFLPGMRVRRYGDAVIFAVIVSLLNTLVWKVLWLFSASFTVLTLGIGAFVLNGLVFLAADRVVKGVEISGCLVAMIAAALVGLLDSAVAWLLR